MSVLFKTDLAEYARQCTLQRRRYEECVQNAQQSGMDQTTAASACSIEPASDLDGYPERTMQGSLIDLLGLSVEPSVWEDKQVALDDAGKGQPEEQPWHGDRSHSIQQQTTSATRKGASSVSYGAP
jgi:hypothetical protein